jgi:uncharacterized membrane protein YfcA
MPSLTLTAMAVLIFMNGIIFTMLGQGGGILYTPIQLFFGIEFQKAAATSLILIMVSSFSSTLVFRKAHKVDWAVGLSLESGTTLGAFCGGWLSYSLTDNHLSTLFAGVILFASIFILRDWTRIPACPDGPSTIFAWKRRLGADRYCVNLPLAWPVSFVSGVLSGLMGISGGLLKIPLLVILFRVPMEIAVASSSFMVGLTAAGGLAGHLVGGTIDWKTTLILAPVVFVAAQLGARESLAVNEVKLKKIFGAFLILIAAAMIARVLL